MFQRLKKLFHRPQPDSDLPTTGAVAVPSAMTGVPLPPAPPPDDKPSQSEGAV
jgi:hypothetical protein